MDLDIYAAIYANFSIIVKDGQLSFGVTDVESAHLEVTVLQDDMLTFEPLLATLLEQNLVPALLGGLSGDALGGLPLPEVEVNDAASGVKLSIGIEPLNVEHQKGNAIVGAKLAPKKEK